MPRLVDRSYRIAFAVSSGVMRGLTQVQKDQFERDGYLVLRSFFSPAEASTLLTRAHELINGLSLEDHPMTAFKTGQDDHVGDDYFLNSGDKIRFFFEPSALDGQGKLNRPKEQAINKVGHALHELDPVFRNFTLNNDRLKKLARSLDAHRDPRVVQSMIICKPPGIGQGGSGEVSIHDDNTFLYTDPPSAIGFWFALEPCTSTNGCLSFVKGSHRKNDPINKRLVRKADGKGTEMRIDGPEHADWSKEEWTEEPCNVGDLVLIHGSVIHRSEKNASDVSRYIYTFHMIEGDAKWDELNWLQPTTSMPFTKLY